MPSIRVRNISKKFEDSIAIEDISFDVQEGELLTLLGPSGSGKTTVLRLIAGLIKPDTGQILFDEKDISGIPTEERNIGFVFQSFNLLPRTTVYENVELPLLYNEKRESKKIIRARVKSALQAVGLERRVDYLSNQLSGGEQQRVAIARALVNDPALILADEPTGNLDSKSGIQVMKILQDLSNQGNTVIMVTHDKLIAEYAKRVIRMLDGKVVEDVKIQVK